MSQSHEASGAPPSKQPAPQPSGTVAEAKKRAQPMGKNEKPATPSKMKKLSAESAADNPSSKPDSKSKSKGNGKDKGKGKGKDHESDKKHGGSIWHHLEHHGVIFPELYTQFGLKLKVKVCDAVARR